ncbi:MAG: efflux RND transporter periplasmic adaptor subunit [Puniceicoccales bacterium]|nr:efflux RND transporter periplasmic adaptor subunit [Puniceicoccales bacterium]
MSTSTGATGDDFVSDDASTTTTDTKVVTDPVTGITTRTTTTITKEKRVTIRKEESSTETTALADEPVTTGDEDEDDLEKILEEDKRKSGKFWWWLLPLLLLLLLLLLTWWWKKTHPAAKLPYLIENVQRGDIAQIIRTTGTLKPRTEVTVGAEVSGQIVEIYVDTNAVVKKGDKLAKIDTKKFSDQVNATTAALASAQELVGKYAADLAESKSYYERRKKLFEASGGRTPSQMELDTDKASYDRALANYNAAIKSVDEQKAKLAIDQTNLDKCLLTAPMDGLVLKKNYEVGATVASSFNAPEIFVIAEPLNKMKLVVNVPEADIVNVATGQHATFRVDAYPNETFDAVVSKIESSSTTTNNVVTYQTELTVDNSAQKFRSDMTAQIDIDVGISRNALWVKPAALRFNPERALPNAAPKASGSLVEKLTPRPPRRPSASAGAGAAPASLRDSGAHIWVWQNKDKHQVPVKVGRRNSDQVEISPIADPTKPDTIKIDEHTRVLTGWNPAQ